jgi:hypothetical protein
MDRAANAAAQARIGIRAGIETLQLLALRSRNADVRRRTSTLLASVRTDYERSLSSAMKEADTKTGTELLAYYGLPVEMMNEAITLPVVVKIIRSDQDLNRVACAFAAFSQLTREPIEVFDFSAVESRCAAVQGRCEPQSWARSLGIQSTRPKPGAEEQVNLQRDVRRPS